MFAFRTTVIVCLIHTFNVLMGSILSPAISNSTHEYYIRSNSTINFTSNDSIICGTTYCHLICDEDDGCIGLKINSSLSDELIIECLLERSCKGFEILTAPTTNLDIYCGLKASCNYAIIEAAHTKNIYILCDYTGNIYYGSCEHMIVNASQSASVTVDCSGGTSCHYGSWYLNNTQHAKFTGDGYYTLSYSQIYANHAKQLDMECDADLACSWMAVYAYNISLMCNVAGSCRYSELYATDMASRILVTCNAPDSCEWSLYQNGYEKDSTIHCAQADFCKLACVYFDACRGDCDVPCIAYPTPSPSSSPTTVTANPTTALPTTITDNPTTALPTAATDNPTTANPTAIPTTAIPTTAIPTTDIPTTVNPTTAIPTAISSTTSTPSTIEPTTTSLTTSICDEIGDNGTCNDSQNVCLECPEDGECDDGEYKIELSIGFQVCDIRVYKNKRDKFYKNTKQCVESTLRDNNFNNFNVTIKQYSLQNSYINTGNKKRDKISFDLEFCGDQQILTDIYLYINSAQSTSQFIDKCNKCYQQLAKIIDGKGFLCIEEGTVEVTFTDSDGKCVICDTDGSYVFCTVFCSIGILIFITLFI